MRRSRRDGVALCGSQAAALNQWRGVPPFCSLQVLGVPYQPPPPPPPLFTSPTAAPGAPVQGRKGARPPAKKTMPGRGGPADEAAVRANRRGVRAAAGLQPKKEEVREEAKTGARAEAVGREKGVEDGTAAEMGAAPVKVEEKGAPFRGEGALLAASGRAMRGAASEALRAMRGQLTTKAYTRQGEGGCERAAAEGKDGHTKAAAAVAGQAKERGEGKGKGKAPPQRKAAAIPLSKPQPRYKPKVPEGSVLPEGSLQIENKVPARPPFPSMAKVYEYCAKHIGIGTRVSIGIFPVHVPFWSTPASLLADGCRTIPRQGCSGALTRVALWSCAEVAGVERDRVPGKVV